LAPKFCLKNASVYIDEIDTRAQKSVKKTVKVSIIFTLLGSKSVKAARKTLMKLTPERSVHKSCSKTGDEMSNVHNKHNLNQIYSI